MPKRWPTSMMSSLLAKVNQLEDSPEIHLQKHEPLLSRNLFLTRKILEVRTFSLQLPSDNLIPSSSRSTKTIMQTNWPQWRSKRSLLRNFNLNLKADKAIDKSMKMEMLSI